MDEIVRNHLLHGTIFAFLTRTKVPGEIRDTQLIKSILSKIFKDLEK